MTERAASLADREADRLHLGQEEAVRDRVAHLVPGDRQRLFLGVQDRFGQSRLDVGHRLAKVVPDHPLAAVLEGVHQSNREGLLDHRRRIAFGDPRKLGAGF